MAVVDRCNSMFYPCNQPFGGELSKEEVVLGAVLKCINSIRGAIGIGEEEQRQIADRTDRGDELQRVRVGHRAAEEEAVTGGLEEGNGSLVRCRLDGTKLDCRHLGQELVHQVMLCGCVGNNKQCARD